MRTRFYLTAKLTAMSPLSIGNGDNVYSDHDVWLDGNGRPMIPGTTLAGVCRHYLKDCGMVDDDLFGRIGREEAESRIVFSDASLVGGYRRSYRDGVSIDDNGVAADTAKFDYEVIEPKTGAYFILKMIIDGWDEASDRERLDTIIGGFRSGAIHVGYKSGRGMGRLGIDAVCAREIRTVDELLDFSWEQVTSPYLPGGECGTRETAETVRFRVSAFVTISDSATNKQKNDGGPINSQPMKNAAGNPVIPGSSWAGVFRHHFKRILEEAGYTGTDAFLGRLFGSTAQASRIGFEESVIEGAHLVDRTRNAIDRFTGGASDKKLFTDEYAFGGSLTLKITLSNRLSEEDRTLAGNLIDLTVKALDKGYVTIGKSGSIGGGLLKKEAAT